MSGEYRSGYEWRNRKVFRRCCHRLSQLWGGKTFCPKIMYEKLTKFPNSTWYLPEKLSKCPNFVWCLSEKLTKLPNFTWYLPENAKNAKILHNNCPKNIFPIFFFWGGHVPPAAPVSYAYVVWRRCRGDVEWQFVPCRLAPEIGGSWPETLLSIHQRYGWSPVRSQVTWCYWVRVWDRLGRQYWRWFARALLDNGG